MKKVNAIIDSIPIYLNVPEEESEFREGVRATGGKLQETEGYLFNFVNPSVLYFENCLVEDDITLLFFHPFVDNKAGVVTETKRLKARDVKIVSSDNPYSVALELRTDFCNKFNIREGSILTLQEEI